MTDFSDADSVYGYLPHADDLGFISGIQRFDGVLVINGPAGAAYEATRKARLFNADDVSLPEGLYWFLDDDLSIIVQVMESTEMHVGSSQLTAEELLANPSHPLANAQGWARHYWSIAEEVPTPRFTLDQAVQHAQTGVDMTIRGRDFVHGAWSYTVSTGGKLVQLLESSIKPLADSGDPSEWISGVRSPAHQFGATLTRAKLEGRFANTLYSFRATRTIFKAYQFKPILKLLQTGKARILIADEVGLGKTIEAGLIWTEMEARREADRVFVVCPASLVDKWKREMDERFGFELREFDGTAAEDFLDKHRRGRLPDRFAYVSSIEKLRTWKGLKELEDFPLSFDLLVMDEAHAMRNMTTKNYATGAQMAQMANAAVFLTATPINLKQEDVLNLTGLLAPEDELDQTTASAQLEPNKYLNRIAAILSKPNPDMYGIRELIEQIKSSEYGAITAERPDFKALESLFSENTISATEVVDARRYIAALNALSTVITRTRKAEVDEDKPVREAQKVEVQWTPEELNFYNAFYKWCDDKAKQSGSSIFFAMQMPLRLASASLATARDFVLTGSGSAIEDPDGGGLQSKAPATYSDASADLVNAANALSAGVDSKLLRLEPILSDLKASGRKALLFTFSKPTLEYLSKKLGSQYRIAVLHGGVNRQKRDQVMKAFRAGAYDFVFANRVASEGLDFEFCSAVINYDLPWNPMEVEQRIGRIDRLGQESSKLLIINFMNLQTIDERIVYRLLERIKIFEDTIGELEPILMEEMTELFSEVDYDMSDEQIDYKIRQIEIAQETKRKQLAELDESASDLFLTNDVDIDGLEEELVRSGRYVGQSELANLITDWAATDGGKAKSDGKVLSISGTVQMAERVNSLALERKRTRSETDAIASQLRQDLPLMLSLDQEDARKNGGILLNANNPLVMAAVNVPGHRQARFATLQTSSMDSNVGAGDYLVILAVAKNASRGGDEIWGEAYNLETGNYDSGAFDLLLAALATGTLNDADVAFDPEVANRATGRLMNRINARHTREQSFRAQESDNFRKSRALAITNQYQRKSATIKHRIEKLKANGVSESVIRMHDGQLRKAQRAEIEHLEKLAIEIDKEIEVEYLAVCVLGVTNGFTKN